MRPKWLNYDTKLNSMTKQLNNFYSPETYASVSGYVFENKFYGTVYMKDSVHYLEPHNRKSRDLRIFGNGLKTLIHRLIIF